MQSDTPHIPPWHGSCPLQAMVAVHDNPHYQRRQPENTVLYQVIQQEYASFEADALAAGRRLPRFIQDTFHRYMDCGILACGFVRVYCAACQVNRLVPFSCKTRGICPSCAARRMSETAAHLADAVIPNVPVRQ